ncbi:hypothetical protein D3C71_1645750 [compost metagenome]
MDADAAPRFLGQRADKALQPTLDRLAFGVGRQLRRGSDHHDAAMLGHRTDGLMEEAIEALGRDRIGTARGVEHQPAVTHVGRPFDVQRLPRRPGQLLQRRRHASPAIGTDQ